MSNYLESASNLTQGLAHLAKGFTLAKFVKWIIVLILIASTALYFYENYFASTYFYNKIDRKISIIDKVQRLGGSDSTIIIKSHKNLQNILDNLDPPQKQFFNSTNVRLFFSKYIVPNFIKILGAIILPLLILLISWRTTEDKKDIIVGAILLAVVFAIIAIIIPTIHSLWVNFILMPIAQIIVLLPFIPKKK